jgi:AcrR family transcriptional regulator
MGRKSIEDVRKPQILAHFRKVLDREGVHKVSAAKIAKSMGVSPNLVLHYFDSKEAMVVAFFDEIMEIYMEYINEVLLDIPKGSQRLKVLIESLFRVGKNKELVIDKPFYAFYYSSLFEDHFRSRFNQKYGQFADLVTIEVAANSPLNGANREDLLKQAEFLLALFEGFSFAANIRANDDNYFEELGQYFSEQACIFFKCGIEEKTTPQQIKG